MFIACDISRLGNGAPRLPGVSFYAKVLFSRNGDCFPSSSPPLKVRRMSLDALGGLDQRYAIAPFPTIGDRASGFRIEESPAFEVALLGARIEGVAAAYNVDGSAKCLLQGNSKAPKREKRERVAAFDADVDVRVPIGLFARIGAKEAGLRNVIQGHHLVGD